MWCIISMTPIIFADPCNHEPCQCHVNSSPPNTAYMHYWIGSALVQIMACGLFGAKPISKPVLAYCHLDSWEQISMKFKSEFYHFHSRKCIWNCRLPKWRPFCPRGDELITCASFACPANITWHGAHYTSTLYMRGRYHEKPLTINVFPDSKVHGANMGATWGRHQVGPMWPTWTLLSGLLHRDWRIQESSRLWRGGSGIRDGQFHVLFLVTPCSQLTREWTRLNSELI